MTDVLDRRRFIAGTIAAGMAAVLGSANAQDIEPKNVNRHLRRMPDGLPHVARRTDDRHENARHGLIVIRQIHWAADLDAEGVREIQACQEEIRDLVDALMKGKWIDSVHQEGRMAAGEPATDARYDSHPGAEQQGLRDVPRIAEYGALRVLEEAGTIVLKGAERTKEFDASGPAVFMEDGPGRDRLLFEDREDALLKIISADRDRIACTVYGAAHDWKDNVERWNDAHPSDAFSLVTLTVKTVAARDKKYRPAAPEAPLPVPPPPPPAPRRTPRDFIPF